jgi:anti-anti-sigma regulatory factor
MALTRADSAGEILVTMQGSSRVAEAESVAKDFLGILAQGAPRVILDLSGLERVDLSLFQLVLAFDKSLEARGRRLEIRALAADHPVPITAALLGIELGPLFQGPGAGR